ncbi:uncharacterized protein K452DRAFT_79064 [Aplosporella prunicola CBS 121167]|uniref:PQ loop repeat protein n=1 Tax=Aplosporella prunicola CBS 121167 TaxID=1176127 RepID=A0A6A6B870_9PEZI|nr:uncharacterized protein K452DRAFT_79064 [Aplosporella prunicola CBS 121167]KAF2138981.1 hypothetical protein K452DRAFT_79064 [Aplosporella prunicola CBS 121167]
MAPQEHIPKAASILGIIPQIWSNWRRKQTDGVPGLMLFLWAAAAVPFGVYDIVQNFNIPLQVQPQIFCALALVCWAQTLIYQDRWPIWKATLAAVSTGIAFGGIEAFFIFLLRDEHEIERGWPILVIGIFADVLLAVGLLPPYGEMWKRGGRVVGLNFLFLSTDFMGALLSLMALVVQQTFDVLGGTLYIVCMFLEIGIFSSHLIWMYRKRHVRAAAKRVGLSYDEYMRGRTDNNDNAEEEEDATRPPGTASTLAECDEGEGRNKRKHSAFSSKESVVKEGAGARA